MYSTGSCEPRNRGRKETLNSILVSFLAPQAALQDSQVELETYKQTRQGLDEMYNVVFKQYKEEKRIRQVGYYRHQFILFIEIADYTHNHCVS